MVRLCDVTLSKDRHQIQQQRVVLIFMKLDLPSLMEFSGSDHLVRMRFKSTLSFSLIIVDALYERRYYPLATLLRHLQLYRDHKQEKLCGMVE